MTQAYTRPGSTTVDYNAVTGDSVTGAAQKLDNAIDDLYGQLVDATVSAKGVVAYGTTATTAAQGNHTHTGVYAPAAEGVTNGNTHDHSGGDGAQIAYSTLSGLPSVLVSADIGVTVQGYDSTTLKSSAIGVTVQGYDADTAKLDLQQAWSKPQRPTPSSVDISSAFDASAYAAIKHTLSTNTTVAAPSNTPTEGDELYMHITGHASDTLSWNTTYKASASTSLPSAPAAGKVLSVCFRYDGTNWQLIGRRVDA